MNVGDFTIDKLMLGGMSLWLIIGVMLSRL
jgi:hypothetical protein